MDLTTGFKVSISSVDKVFDKAFVLTRFQPQSY